MVAYVVLEQEGARPEEKKEEPPSPASPEPAEEDDPEAQERAARLERVRHSVYSGFAYQEWEDPKGSTSS